MPAQADMTIWGYFKQPSQRPARQISRINLALTQTNFIKPRLLLSWRQFYTNALL